MRTDEDRLRSWVDVVGHLLRDQLVEFPHRLLLQQFASTFDAEPSWAWVRADGSFGFELLRPIANWPREDELEYWRTEGMQRHPIIKWYATTGVPDVQTIGRVPLAVSGRADRDIVTGQLRSVGLDQQLSVPYHFSGSGFASFVLARTGSDFSDDDVELCKRVQPLLYLLDRQVRTLATDAGACQMARATGLTGREVAVVRLLAEGYTATAIARRLGSSPRTVNKHLEHVYRKLGVRDRLTAVRSAQQQGLLGAS